MNEENGSPMPPPSEGGQYPDKTPWLLVAFLPSLIASIMILQKPGQDALSERNIWLLVISSACYLLGLTFVYGSKIKKRGYELFDFSVGTMVILLVANFTVCVMANFAGCVCGVSELSRINR